MEPGVVSVGFPDDEQHKGFVSRYAARYRLPWAIVDINRRLFESADIIKYARFCLLWNGHQGATADAALLCRRRGIPIAFYEWGLLPQKSTFLCDTQGFCGDSSLCRPPAWVTDDDMLRLRLARSELQRKYPIRPSLKPLLVMQIENDTQILYNTDVRTMQEFIDDVQARMPGVSFAVRPHPKSKAVRTLPDGWEVDTEPDFLGRAARSPLVVGLTSTCLVEAAVLGVPVLALGDHPLARVFGGQRDRVLAGYLASRVNRDADDPSMVLERQNVRPLGCSRIIPPMLPHLPTLS